MNMNKKPSQPLSPEKALMRMMRICASKEYCTGEIEKKLLQLNIDENDIATIIATLKEKKFIDDERYVRSYINDKLNFGKWGKEKITYHLKSKQIPDALVQKAFSDISNETLTASLKPLLEKKIKSVKGETSYEKRTKLIRFALGRGFSMKDILKELDHIVIEDD